MSALRFHHSSFLVDIEPADEPVDFCLVAALGGDANFGGGRRKFSSDATESDPIGADLFEP